MGCASSGSFLERRSRSRSCCFRLGRADRSQQTISLDSISENQGEVGFPASHFELSHVGAQLFERVAGVEIPVEEVGDGPAEHAAEGTVFLPRVPPADLAGEAEASHDFEHAFGRDFLAKLVVEGHPYLPVPATVWTPIPNPFHERLQVWASEVSGVGDVVEVGGSG